MVALRRQKDSERKRNVPLGNGREEVLTDPNAAKPRIDSSPNNIIKCDSHQTPLRLKSNSIAARLQSSLITWSERCTHMQNRTAPSTCSSSFSRFMRKGERNCYWLANHIAQRVDYYDISELQPITLHLVMSQSRHTSPFTAPLPQFTPRYFSISTTSPSWLTSMPFLSTMPTSTFHKFSPF